MIRFAKKEELEKINELRKQVNDIHVNGRPDIFKQGFNETLSNYIYEIWEDENKKIVVADYDGEICGFAVLSAIDKQENPFMKARRFLDVDEFAVDEHHRRKGIAREMISFIKEYARNQKFERLELNMWEFNEGALSFYEEVGFHTYRRYMEMDLQEQVHDCKDISNTNKVEKETLLEKYPILEFDEQGVPKVDPEVFLKGHSLGSDQLVITFFPEAMIQLKKENKIELVHTIGGENPVEIYRFVESNVLITLGYVGCPACAGNLECFYALGIRKVMFCGGGGVLDKNISVGTLLVVEGAIRDEGFSFQYVAPSRVIYTDQKVTSKVEHYLEERKIPYIKGLTWTTDAMFRETPSRIEKRKAEGAKIVEMEQSGCIAVAQYKGLDYGAIIYGGDDVSGETWDDRGWNSRAGIRYDLLLLCKDIVGIL